MDVMTIVLTVALVASLTALVVVLFTRRAPATTVDVTAAALEPIVRIIQQQVAVQLQLADQQLATRQGMIDEKLGQVQAGVTEHVRQLSAAVQQLTSSATQQFGVVGTSLQAQAEATAQLHRVAGTLRDALANTNARGQWGERMADDVLRLSGMLPNVNYVQRTAVEGDGRGIPDFTFLLPDGHVMFMDVKFPVDSYLQFLGATTDVERAMHRDAFLKAVKGHVTALSKRDYSKVDDRPAVDNVLMFVPNESIVAFIHEHAPTLVDEALAQHVVLCSPLSLFTLLGVVRQAFDNFQVQQTSKDVIDLLGKFGSEWRRYTDSVNKVRKQLDTVTTSFAELTGTRMRQLERPLREIDQLRAQGGVAVDGSLATLPDDQVDALERPVVADPSDTLA